MVGAFTLPFGVVAVLELLHVGEVREERDQLGSRAARRRDLLPDVGREPAGVPRTMIFVDDAEEYRVEADRGVPKRRGPAAYWIA